MEQERQKLKDEVRKMISEATDEPSQIISLIDLVQRLGVSYHYETEIEQALQQLLNTKSENDNLHDTALRFRLLRDHGFNVSSDVFNKFKDSSSNFNENIKSDLQGLLSLYEASHYQIHGEEILDEAFDFCSAQLDSIASESTPTLAAQIRRTLKQTIRKSLPRVEARNFISIYQQNASHNEILLKFAKLDFNILQKLHQKELKEIAEWWKDLDYKTKLPFIRDRMVEGYFWIIGIYFEPQYSFARRFLTKVICITSVIDDIYDSYGTLEELVLFTDAIDRWDINCMDQLPDYIKLCFKALLDVYEEMEGSLAKQGRSECLVYSKEEMKKLVKAYIVEVTWMNKNFVPTLDEYMRNAIVSCGFTLISITAFTGMDESVATKEVFEWASNVPKIIKAASVICRLMDDVAGHEFEQERGHVASSVECYMKENGVSKEETRLEFQKRIIDSWKDINEEFLRPTDVPMVFLTRVLNFTRVMDHLYKDGYEYTHVGELMKSCVSGLLIDSISM